MTEIGFSGYRINPGDLSDKALNKIRTANSNDDKVVDLGADGAISNMKELEDLKGATKDGGGFFVKSGDKITYVDSADLSDKDIKNITKELKKDKSEPVSISFNEIPVKYREHQTKMQNKINGTLSEINPSTVDQMGKYLNENRSPDPKVKGTVDKVWKED